MMHRVLWFDDKCNQFPNLPKIFELHGLQLIPCETAEKFLHELNVDSDHQIMAVILDYLDENTSPRSYVECNRQSAAKGLPIFTYSAQQSMLEQNDFFMATIDCKYLYDKGSTEDRNRLISDIESLIASKEKNSLCVKEMYIDLFNAIARVGDSNIEKYVLKFLRSYTFQEDRELRPAAVDFRNIYEPLFLFLHDRGLLPKECFKTNGRPTVKDIQRYLKGDSTEFICGSKCAIGVIDIKGPILPEELSSQLEEIIDASNKDAHSSPANSLSIISDYILQKQFIELCGILIYLVHYCMDESQKSPQNNRSRCFRYNEYSIEKDNDGISHLGSCLIQEPGKNWNKYKLIRNTSEQTSERYPLLLKLK